MNFDELNKKIESSNYYRFTQRHRKIILIIQGFFIIGLLLSMNIYVYKDHFLKKEIAENCGYVTSKYKCVCEEHFVKEWEEIQKGNYKINLSNIMNVYP